MPNHYAQPLERKNNDPDVQFEDQLNELFEDADQADLALGKLIADVCKLVPGAIKHVPVKNKDTTREKLLIRKGAKKDPKTILDAARASIFYDDLLGVFAAQAYIESRPECVKVVDRFVIRDAESSGYRDVKFFLKVEVVKAATRQKSHHYCELQLNLKVMGKASPIAHPVYEVVRLADGKWPMGIEARKVAKLGNELLHAWVWLKQRGVLAGQPKLLADFKDAVQCFLAAIEASKKSKQEYGVALSEYHVQAMSDICPYIYKMHMGKALHARVMKDGGLQPVITVDQKKQLTGMKEKLVL